MVIVAAINLADIAIMSGANQNKGHMLCAGFCLAMQARRMKKDSLFFCCTSKGETLPLVVKSAQITLLIVTIFIYS